MEQRGGFAGLNEVDAPAPDENHEEGATHQRGSLEAVRTTSRLSNGEKSSAQKRRRRSSLGVSQDGSWEKEAQDDGFEGLGELEAPPPDENPDDQQYYRRGSLEVARTASRQRSQSRRKSAADGDQKSASRYPRLLTQLYTYSWLVLFSILGTLARLGTQWITYYPNAPVTTNELWANVGGCFVMGFLMEDRALFRTQPGKGGDGTSTPKIKVESDSASENEKAQNEVDHIAQEFEKRRTVKAHISHKKTLPLYIGLTVGFCGSYTSFSSLVRDAFLAMSNDLVAKNAGPSTRSAGWNVCAVLAVFIYEIGLSLLALSAGAHVCEVLMPLSSKIPAMRISHILNPVGVVLGFGCWLGAVFLAIWPPAKHWRGDCVFAIVFAPIGCLLRFELAIHLNTRVARFPLGTFVANIFGSLILAMCYNLQHAPLSSDLISGGLVGCQVLQGIMDGFCGCLTTVSTWVAELKGLHKRHAYGYGFASITAGFALMLVVIGPLHWTIGLTRPLCVV